MEDKEVIRLRGIKYRNKLKETNPEKHEKVRLANLANQLRLRLQKAEAEGREYKFRNTNPVRLTPEEKKESERLRAKAYRAKVKAIKLSLPKTQAQLDRIAKKQPKPKIYKMVAVRKNAKTPEEQKQRRLEYQRKQTAKRSLERAERRALQALVAPEPKEPKPKVSRVRKGCSDKAYVEREEKQFETRSIDESKCTKIWIACIKANVLVPPGKTEQQVIAKWEAYSNAKRASLGKYV